MLLPTLLMLTLETGVIDAFSYLALGSVFTANMTGNVILIGLAFGGVPGFSISRTAAAVIGFGIGGVLAGRLSRHWRRNPFIWMRRSTGIEIALLSLTGIATIGLELGLHVANSPQRYVAVVLLSLTMGMRNATIRRLGFTDVPTTVLTSTLSDLAADSRLGGGERRRQGRRAAAIVLMGIGAAIGAVLVRHVDPHAALGMALMLLLAVAAHQAVIMHRYPLPTNQPRPGRADE